MRRNLVMLVALALLWGASFMFIKIADRHLAPATLILGRLGLGALTLALIVPFTVGWRGTVAATRENWRWLLVVALLNTAAPFWLLAWGEDEDRLRPRLDRPGSSADLQCPLCVRVLP